MNEPSVTAVILPFSVPAKDEPHSIPQLPMVQVWEMVLQLLPRHMALPLPQMRSMLIRTFWDKMVI